MTDEATCSLDERFSPLQLDLGAGAHELQQPVWMPREIDREPAPVGPTAVDIREVVFSCHLPGAEQLPCARHDLLISRQRGHRTRSPCWLRQ